MPDSPSTATAEELPVADRFNRVHKSLRLSITDACNIRCQYCMPDGAVQFLKQRHLLSALELEAFVAIALELGFTNVRITGGEPLLRHDLPEIVSRLASLENLRNIALTTNGMLLEEKIGPLVSAGLRRINISLDTLKDDTFKKLARRDGLERVLAGITAAKQHADLEVKLNALILKDINLEEVIELVRFAKRLELPLRFIEFMPLDADRAWSEQRMVTGKQIRQHIQNEFGNLTRLSPTDPSRPASNYTLADGYCLGFIDSVSQPFCGACDRLRLTADGKLRNCLFGTEEWDVSELIRLQATHASSETREAIIAQVRSCVRAKHPSHGIADSGFEPPSRAMYQIGG